MSEPDLYDILLRAFFPAGIPPHQYGNLAVLTLDISELYDLYYQVQRCEEEHNNQDGNIICRKGAERQDATLRNVAEPVNKATKEVTQSTHREATSPAKPFIVGTYPSNFEEAPIEHADKSKRMGRPPREPGSLGIKCPKCGSSDVVSGGYGPNKERRIKCKACGSQPTLTESHVSNEVMS